MRSFTAALLCASLVSAAFASKTSDLKALLESKANRYPGPGHSHCHVESISMKSISFSTIAGDKKSNHTEHIELNWGDVSSITFAKNANYPHFTTLRLGLRKQVHVQMSTTMDGRDQSQNGLDDKVDFDFPTHKNAEKGRDLVQEILVANHPTPPPHRHWQGGK